MLHRAQIASTTPAAAAITNLLLLRLLLLTRHRLSLLRLTFLTTLPRSLSLSTLGVHLLLEHPLTSLLSLSLVDLHDEPH